VVGGAAQLYVMPKEMSAVEVGMKTITLTLLCLLVASATAFSDDKATYEQLLQQQKYPELLKHLQKWEVSEPRNPEVYIAYFNYYLSIGRKEGVSIDKAPKRGADVLTITDPKTNKVLGYMNPSTIYNTDDVAQALIKLNEGMSYGPDRLDMYFGKIFILNEVFDYRTAGSVLVEVLNRSQANGNRWFWSNNEPVKNAEFFLLNSVQDYYEKWLENGSDAALRSVTAAADLQMRMYPGNIYAYNDMGFAYAVKKDYRQALACFLQAEKIDKRDGIVLANVAHTYVEIGRKDKAIEYYNKMLQYGNDEDKQYAKARLAELK
jgi:tetratricopeptide (TPR) repeat protein